MKTKLLLTSLLSFVFCLLSSQIPQGFNYQAIVRNLTGEVIQNQPVKVKVSIQNLGGTVFWNEEHSLNTTQFGLAAFIVGDGPNVSGTIPSFSMIDWNAQVIYLRTQVQYPVGGSYSDMGTTQIWSVPYSLVAKDVEGPVGKLGIRSYETNNDSALFKVINKDGNVVFAVYNEGVRVQVADATKGTKGGFAVGGFGSDKAASQPYMMVTADSIRMYLDSDITSKGAKGGFAVGGFDMSKGPVQPYLNISKDSVRIYIDTDTLTKKPKGGFAVGGFDLSKGTPHEFFRVTRDSTRVYINEPAKGTKGGFAVGSYDMSKGTVKNFLNVELSEDYLIKPSEPRIFWYPLKNAFLAGQVLIQHKDSIGVNSTTTGYESRAKGGWSQAMGFMAVARGDYSTAIGKNAFAGKESSFAFGDGVSALNRYSYAFGKGSKTQGDYSFALGNAATASGYSSYAFGEGVTAAGSYSYAFGKSSTTGNSYAFAMGNEAAAGGFSSYAFGESTIAANQYSYSFGKGSKAQGDYAFSFGNTATASGANSFALGESVTASFPNSYAFGKGSSATNSNAIAMGLNASASGSAAFSINGVASGANSFAISGTAQGIGSIAVNGIAVGNYSKSFGGTANGANSMSSGSIVTATGDYSLAMGYRVATNGRYAVAIGAGDYLPPYSTTYAGAESAISIGSQTKANAKRSVAIGNFSVANGENSVSIGTLSTASGVASMALGNLLTAGSAWSTAIGYLNYSWGSALDASNLSDPLFLIGNGFSGSESNAVTILKNGKVGIGTGTGMPTHLLDVRGQMRMTESSTYDVWIQGGGVTGSGYTDNRNLSLIGFDEDSGDKLFVNFLGEYLGGTEIGGPVTVPGTLSVTGALTFADPFTRTITTPRVMYINAAGLVGGNSSSIKYKENVLELNNYDWLYNLRPVYYNYKNTNPDDLQYGLIAEEVNEINPLLVIYGSDNKPDGLMYERLTVPMLKAIQDQKKEIESTKLENQQLKSELQSLRDEINQIKTLLAKGAVE
jgi:hypothetical protein